MAHVGLRRFRLGVYVALGEVITRGCLRQMNGPDLLGVTMT
jgi:hypothetical protein